MERFLRITSRIKDKDVGFKEMLDKRSMRWPKTLKEIPQSWSGGSQNLGNELHCDGDGDHRSFALWVNSNGGASRSWNFLLFPEWEVATEMTNGTWISWEGRHCGHCLAVPVVAPGD